MASTSLRSTATGVCRASSTSIALLDRGVAAVDLVVEGDDLVGELRVRLAQRVERPAQRTQDELPLLEQVRVDRVEIFLEGDSHPNLPVT